MATLRLQGEGGYHPRKQTSNPRHPSVDFFHSPVAVWVNSAPQPKRWGPRAHRGSIQPKTARNRLREHHIRPCRPYVHTLLLPRHRAECLRWSRAHLRWSLREWEAVLFSDESRFSLDHSDGRIMVYRRMGERYQDARVRQRRAFGGGSVMVWGGISAHSRTPLVIIDGNLNAQRYPEEVVRPHVLPFVCGQRRSMIFQQDNARPHVARLNMNFLRHENVLVMAWPSMSPDLSLTEHVWDEMDRSDRWRQMRFCLWWKWQALHNKW